MKKVFKNLMEPFPFEIFGVNVTIPSVLMLAWIILLTVNVTLWGGIGVYEAIKVVF